MSKITIAGARSLTVVYIRLLCCGTDRRGPEGARAMRPLWYDTELDPQPGILVVDCGYLQDPVARARVERLRALGIGKANVRLEGLGRLLVRIPPRKQAAVRAACPLVAGKAYFGATHRWAPAPEDAPGG